MNRVNSLLKVYRQNAEMPMPKKGLRGSLYLSFGFIALFCIMLPCCLIVGYITDIMSQALMTSGNRVDALSSEMHLISAMSMIFGMLVVFNVLFFSSDREHMVTLPLTPMQILAAKFRFTYLAESIMEFAVLLSMFIGFYVASAENYGAAETFGIVSLLSALIGTIITPLLPLTYCTILSLVLMHVLRKVRNSRVFYRSSTVLLLLFVGLFLLSFRGMGGITVENYVDSLLAKNNLFFRVCDLLFFTNPLLCRAIGEGSLLSLLLCLAGNATAVGLMLLLGRFTYQEGLYTAGALGSPRKKVRREDLSLKLSSPFRSYLKKEWKVLTRTKAYLSNCILINLLFPFGTALFFYLSKSNPNVSRFIELYRGGFPRASLLLLLIMIALSFIASALNSLASTAFTREGAHLDLIRYIPLDYQTQIHAKATTAFLITAPPLMLTVLLTAYFLNIRPVWVLFYCVLALSSLILQIMIGLSMDSAAPYTLWDDEYSALRGNLNSFFNMAVSMVLAVFLCVFAFLLFELTPVGITAVHIVLLVVMLALDILAVIFLGKIIHRNIENY